MEGKREGDVNPREAEAIVSLIKAMTQHPAYAGKTIGVISMVKEDQALLIQSLLHKRIDSVELDRRRILAGISAEFQGDERDIMFAVARRQLAGGRLHAAHVARGCVRAGQEALQRRGELRARSAAGSCIRSMRIGISTPDDLRFQLLQHAGIRLRCCGRRARSIRDPESPSSRRSCGA